MPILLTGATGFVGGHLAETLLAGGDRSVVGLSRAVAWPREWAHLQSRVPIVQCDLCDRSKVEAVLRDLRPDAIYHLAGYASPGRSFAEPDAAWIGNLDATRGLYEAVLRWGGKPRILYVGSGQVYGEGGSVPLDENAPLRPSSPYAASKAAADLAGYQYARSTGLDIVRARPFNHIGPRQSSDYAVPNFARQIAVILRDGRPPVIETGNLGSSRDLSDVRDVAAAYVLLLAKGRSGEAYNIAAGRAWTMREVLDRLIEFAGVAVEVQERADLARLVDPPAPTVDVSKLRRETGWVPKFTLERTLKETLAYWQREAA